LGVSYGSRGKGRAANEQQAGVGMAEINGSMANENGSIANSGDK